MVRQVTELRPTSPATTQAVARTLERVAWLMDRAIKVPGTKITIGLDALLGLFPVGGDLLTGIVQSGLVLVALYHYKVPRTVAARMAGNVLLDIAIGSIPLLGDLFDVAFKANTRNLRLLEPYRHGAWSAGGEPAVLLPGSAGPQSSQDPRAETRRRGTPWRLILPIAAALFAALTLVVIGLVTVVRWLI